MGSIAIPGLAAALLATVVTARSGAQVTPQVDDGMYKSFFTTEDRAARIRVFNALSSEEKAALMSTHLRRWMAANVDTLTGEEIAVIGEMLALLKPGLYKEPKDAEVAAALPVVSQRAETLLGPVRAWQAFRIQSAYVPPTKR